MTIGSEFPQDVGIQQLQRREAIRRGLSDHRRLNPPYDRTHAKIVGRGSKHSISGVADGLHRPTLHPLAEAATVQISYNHTTQATTPAASTSVTTAQTGLTNRGATASAGITFVPVTIGRTRSCRFNKA